MKQYLPYLLCLVLFVGCKEDEPVPVPVTPTPEPKIQQVCFCTEALYDAWNGKSRSEFLYDTNDKLVRVNYYPPQSNPELSTLDGYDTFEYDDRGNIIRRKLHVANSGAWAVATEVTYNDDGLQTEMIEYRLNAAYPNPNPVSRLTTYQYSPSLQLLNSQTENKDSKGLVTESISSYSYEYNANGTLTRRSNRLFPTEPDYRSKSVFTFSGKAHPFAASPAYLKLALEYLNATPTNNMYSILTLEIYNQYKTYDYADKIDLSASYDVTFEYNDAGYPTKEIKTYRDSRVETITYTYICK